jgi:ribonuclease P protein component
VKEGNTLGKHERLKHRKLIGQLFSKGHSFLVYPYKVVWMAAPTPGEAPVNVMFAVTKRSFKAAVKRNRMRRLMKEAYRLNKGELYTSLMAKNRGIVLGFIYLGNELKTFQETSDKILLILRRLTEENEKAPD